MTYPLWSCATAPNIQLSKYSYSMRYSKPSDRYSCGFSPNGMYFTESKKSVRFEESARKLQFRSAGNGLNGGRAGSGGGPGHGGSGVCAREGTAASAIRKPIRTSQQPVRRSLKTPKRRRYDCRTIRILIPHDKSRHSAYRDRELHVRTLPRIFAYAGNVSWNHVCSVNLFRQEPRATLLA